MRSRASADSEPASHHGPQWGLRPSPGVDESFPGAGGGGGVALNGARVTPISGFFVGRGALGVQESLLRHTGGSLSEVAGGGGGGGAGTDGLFAGAGGTVLGAGRALLGGGLAVVEAAGVTSVNCSVPRDTTITVDRTIAASATAASAAAAALVRYHGCTTRTRRCSMRLGFQVPIGALAGSSGAGAVGGTSSGPTSSGPLSSRSWIDAIGIGAVIASTGA